MNIFYEKYLKYKSKYLEYKNLIGGQLINVENIKELTKKISIPRPIESENLRLVKQIIMSKLKELDMLTYEDKFSQSIRNKTYNFSNIISYNSKATLQYILLAAHIDSLHKDNTFQGAIDSAVSISIIIEIAKNLLKMNKNYPIMIVFFDGEEAIDGSWSNDNTLIGSRYFVNNFDLSKIKQLYLLDLIGGNMSNKFYAFNDNLLSINQIKRLYEINKKYKENLFVSPSLSVESKVIQDDHIPFKEKNINYLHLIPMPYPIQHHKISDTFDNLNWDHIEIFSKILYEYIQ